MHQPVGWQLLEPNLFAYFFKLSSYRQRNAKVLQTSQKTKREKNLFVLVLSNKQNKISKQYYNKGMEIYHHVLKNCLLSQIYRSFIL